MGEKGNAVAAAATAAPGGEGLVAAVVDGGANIGSELGDHAARTIVALGTERAVEGLIERHRSDATDGPEEDVHEPGASGSPPASS